MWISNFEKIYLDFLIKYINLLLKIDKEILNYFKKKILIIFLNIIMKIKKFFNFYIFKPFKFYKLYNFYK